MVVLRPSRWLSLPKYLGTLGMYGFWRKRHTYVLTNQRMLLGKGIFVRTERSLPISQIEDAAFRAPRGRRLLRSHGEIARADADRQGRPLVGAQRPPADGRDPGSHLAGIRSAALSPSSARCRRCGGPLGSAILQVRLSSFRIERIPLVLHTRP